jgi:hypothetical protein
MPKRKKKTRSGNKMRIIIEFDVKNSSPLFIINKIDEILDMLLEHGDLEDYSLSVDAKDFEQIILVAKILEEESANNEA